MSKSVDMYTAKNAMRKEVLDSGNSISVSKLNGSVLTITECARFKKQLEAMLKELPSADGEGYAGLLKALGSSLIAIKTSSVCTAEKLVASTAAKDTGYTEINDESRKEAEARNVNNQRVLGVKAGTIALTEKLLGQEYVREITHNENGTQKSIDEISLAKLIKHITDSAQRQKWSEIRQQLVKFANHQFDFSKTISVNMVALQTIRERLQLVGVVIDLSQVALVMLANIEDVSQEKHGVQFIPVLQKFGQDYTHDHTHDSASLMAMKRVLAQVDSIRDLSKAPANGHLAAAADEVSVLTEFAAEAGEFEDPETKPKDKSKSKYAQGSNGNRRGRSKSRSRSNNDNATSQCPFCNKFGITPKHADDKQDTCWFNPAYKGWRPTFAITKINAKAGKNILTFKRRQFYPPELGGFPAYVGQEQCSFADEWSEYSSE